MRTKIFSSKGTTWNCQKYNKCTNTTVAQNKRTKRNQLLTPVVMLYFPNSINETYILKYYKLIAKTDQRYIQR